MTSMSAAARTSIRAMAALTVMLGLVIATATWLRSAKGYNAAVESGRLSSQNGVGFFTRDKDVIALLAQVPPVELLGPEDGDSVFTVLRDAAPQGAAPEPPEDSPAVDLLSADERLADAMRGVDVQTIWDAAPLLVFSDDERLLAASFAAFAERNPGAFAITEQIDADEEQGANGRSALLGYLWHVQSLVLPKLERLVRGGQPHAAQRLARNTTEVLTVFNIVNSGLDRVTRRRLNAVYLAEVLLERPDEVFRQRDEALAALRDLRIMIDPDGDDELRSWTGPASYTRILGLSRMVSDEEYASVDAAALRGFSPTRKEADLINLLLVRAPFFRFYNDCQRWVEQEESCPRLRADLTRALRERAPAITRPAFQRDVARYRSEASTW